MYKPEEYKAKFTDITDEELEEYKEVYDIWYEKYQRPWDELNESWMELMEELKVPWLLNKLTILANKAQDYVSSLFEKMYHFRM